MCEGVFLFERCSAPTALAPTSSDVSQLRGSLTARGSWLVFPKNKLSVSHVSARGETVYLDVDISNESCYEGPLGGGKKVI